MIKKFLIGAIGLLLLVGALVGIGFATGVFKAPELVEFTNEWGTVTQDSTEIVTSITLNNPNPIGISLGGIGLEVEIELNGIDFGKGVAEGIDLPKGLSTTTLMTRIDNAAIPQWWATHVTNGEQTIARIVPRATTSLFGKQFGINTPVITRTIKTDLLSNVNSAVPEELSLGPISITLQSRQFSWGGRHE